MENPMVTRDECTRLLKCLDVAFVPSETGGFNCRADNVVGKFQALTEVVSLIAAPQTITETIFTR
jgi:hypothetical protein